MRRVIALAVTGLSLAGCGGTLFPGAGTMDIVLESTPPGADAITSLGPACKTPCTAAVPSPTDDFSVSFSLNGFQPMTVPVRITRSAGSLMMPPQSRGGATSADRPASEAAGKEKAGGGGAVSIRRARA